MNLSEHPPSRAVLLTGKRSHFLIFLILKSSIQISFCCNAGYNELGSYVKKLLDRLAKEGFLKTALDPNDYRKKIFKPWEKCLKMLGIKLHL